MKVQFVNVLQEGDVVNDYFVASRKDLRDQARGGKFLGMVFKDRTGEVGGILWNNAESIAGLFEVGDVVKVRGTVNTYQGRLQIRVDQVLPLKDDEYQLDDLVYVPQNIEDELAGYRTVLETIEEPWLRRLVDSFLADEDFMGRFADAAAGKKWHHAHRGGLLRHCHEISRIALCMCELYPDMNRDLLVTAVFLHDIGKLDEMSHDLNVDYTTEGKLVGHLQLASDLVSKRIDMIDGFPPTLRLHLMHCILAHHGELINGSPVLPKTTEAMVLFQCDNLDAQADAFSRITEETRGKDQEWSDYIPLIERQIWAGI